MPVPFQNSETSKNLMRAFAGESQARNRYTFAAGLCKKQQLHVLEAVFQFTAGQEKEHAEIFYNHMKTMAGKSIQVDGSYPVDITNDTVQLLRYAQHNEYEEFDSAYPAFAATAMQEGFPEIASSFQQIAKIEQTHGNRFGVLADLLENGKLFVSDIKISWMCLNCGHIHEGTEAPKACPVCQHNQGFFIRLEMAPYGSTIIK